MIKPRWLTLILIWTALTFDVGQSQARWFALPGLYYTQDLGWVMTALAVSENQRRDRFLLDFSYYQKSVGQARISYFFPRTSREWTFQAEYQSLDYPGFSLQNASDQSEIYPARRRLLEFGVSCDFPKAGGLFYGLGGKWRHFEYLRETGAEIISLPTITFKDGQEYFGILRAGWERRNNRYHTIKGTYFLWQLDLGAAQSGGATNELVRLTADLRRYLPLGGNMTVLALNLRGGILHHRLPYFSRFTLGGQADLRGFPNDRYNGNAFYLARAEVRQMVIDSLNISMQVARMMIPGLPDFEVSAGFVVFTDGGDLWRDDRRWWGFRQSVGVGLRLILPPSVVASLDVARPVDNGNLAFYLSLEQSF